MVEILCGEDWEHSEDISTVPQEHWRWFLGAKVGSWRVKDIAGTAKPLLANLRILERGDGWKLLGFENWPTALEFFGLDETKWNWLQAGEPVLLDSDSVEQAEAKGRGRLAAQMVRDEKITHQEAADRVGVSRQAVTKAMATESSKLEEKVAIPEWITHFRDRADFPKLSSEGQQLVVTRKSSLNSVCVREGIRPQPVRLSPLELAQKSFRRLSKPDRDAFDSWRAEHPL